MKVPAYLEQAAHSLISAIPGVVFQGMKEQVWPGMQPTRIQPSSRPGTTRHFELSVDGWSPSLHKFSMQWRAAFPGTATPEELVSDLKIKLAAQIENQRNRAKAALAMNIAAPQISKAGDSDVEIGHLYIDRTLGDYLAMEAAENFKKFLDARAPRKLDFEGHALPDKKIAASFMRDKVLAHVAMVHFSSLNDRGIDIAHGSVNDEGENSVVYEDANTGRRYVGFGKTFHHQGIDTYLNWKMFVAHNVLLPHAAIGASIGRPMHEVMPFHPMVDQRIIKEIETHSKTVALSGGGNIEVPRLVFTFEPDEVSVRDLIANFNPPS